MDFGLDFNGGGNGGGGFSGGGGGGFGNDDNSGGGSQQQQRPRRAYDEQTITPITCGMALTAQADRSGGAEDRLKLPDGRMIGHVSLVAAVRSVEDHSTNVRYSVEDGTGLLDVKQWADDSDPSNIQEMRHNRTVKDNIFIKVIGQLKEYEGNKMIVAQSVRPLDTGDQLTHHMLHVVLSGEKYKNSNSIISPAAVASNVGMGAPIMAGSGAVPTSLKDRICQYLIKTHGDGDEGTHVNKIAEELGATEAEVYQSAQELLTEGHIFSTVDDNHYQWAN